jgi:RimJ/RimL family protein N-acetyltransferase
VNGIRIRPYRLDDAKAIWEAVRASMTELQPWMPWCHPAYSIDEARSWLGVQVQAFQQRTTFEFAITTDEGAYLGGCGLNQIDALNQRANLGYWVRSSAAGRGVATAATGLTRDWGFANTDLARIEILVAVGNVASRRVAEKSGAVYEGTLRGRLVVHGIRHDAAMYAFVKSGVRS